MKTLLIIHGWISLDWSYTGVTGPRYWSSLGYPDCAGSQQSPINILTAQSVCNTNLEMVYENFDTPLTNMIVSNVAGGKRKRRVSARSLFDSNFDVKVQLLYSGDEASRPSISGTATNGTKYFFYGMHWHWGAHNQWGTEHAADGFRYASEVINIQLHA